MTRSIQFSRLQVDEGLVPLEGCPGETSTRGLDTLAAACAEYKAAGEDAAGRSLRRVLGGLVCVSFWVGCVGGTGSSLRCVQSCG